MWFKTQEKENILILFFGLSGLNTNGLITE